MERRVYVGPEPLAFERAHQWLSADPAVGAVVLFNGQVRDDAGAVSALELEHFPGMAEQGLGDIIERAGQRWPLNRVWVSHRVGRISVGEGIVLVGVASGHRQAAFAAASFIMDFLKTEAPFWKKAWHGDDGHWVEARQSDQDARARWVDEAD